APSDPTGADGHPTPHRQFVEEEALDFARRHPDVVLYVSPRASPAPLLVSGLDIIRIRKPFHTDNPSVQGQWHPLTNKPSILTIQGPRLQPK
ncbi:PREDICTED: 39S ribosomal protein L43, mitochondrial, partial [Eurypyga helias]|uniref:39S ribosomal protein L43, mitochondrial n=1 Tax=Eurypyga helias TaxID=54383 RepID=UPI000528441A